MAGTFGFGTDTTGFSSTVHDAIQKQVIATLRAGLVALPKGAVVPSTVLSQHGDNFTMRVTEYPDLTDANGGTLTEGVAPTAVKLGIDVQDYTVTQKGAWTKVTDIAQLQSPHNLFSVAADKIARLAVQTIDTIALAALNAHTIDREYLIGALTTAALMDAKGELQARNVQPIPGVGYYALIHPFALRGLETETSLNGYVDIAAQVNPGDISKGVVSQYRGFSFLSSSRIVGALSTGRTGPTAAFATDLYTLAAHGLPNGARIQFSALTGGGTNVVINTDYYIRDATTNTFKIAATRGGASIDLNTSDITASTLKSEQYPVIFMGKDSVAFGDVSSLSYHHWSDAGVGNELQQLMGVGFKGILGGAVLSFSETADGAGNNSAVTDRVYSISVMTGQTA